MGQITRSNLGIPPARIGMVVFLAAEAMMFAGLMSAFGVLRAQVAGEWPPSELPTLPLWITGLNAAVLIASGVLVSRQRRSEADQPRPLNLALWLGAVFVAIQGVEWSRLLIHGYESAAGAAAGVFYGIIAMHTLHVLAGLAILFWVRRSWFTSPHRDERLLTSSWYWYFVCGLWPILAGMLYLI